MQKTWFITGATRGLGVEIAKGAIRAGDRVVATGRRKSAVTDALGPDSEQLLALELDVTDGDQAQKAVQAAVSRFGTIDVLVNNAGYGQLGFFEENTVETVNTQFATNIHGVFNVTWAVLPVMRTARKGHIFNISSIAGLRGGEFGSLYSASKFAIEGFSESLALEIAPFGLFVTIVEPGPFRTDFLTGDSLRIGHGTTIADYDDRRASQRAAFESRNGSQPGDPIKLADAMVLLSKEAKPPLRFAAGAMAVNAAAVKFASLQAELELWRQLSLNTDGPDGSW
jgi:NAD(P)-dependent dehydrogenase (short-subunit alcohol dehydrogenase family)